jgi:hypothetical protein
MQDDEYLRRLSEALRSSDDPGVEPIVARAREAAVREATAILEALMTRSILERAVDHLAVGPDAAGSDAPPARSAETLESEESEESDEPGEVPERLWYVYGIQPADADPPTAATGIVGAAVDCVETEGLRALVSRVRSADFGQPELIDKLDDLEWVGDNAQAHEAVLGAALTAGPVLPLRFATVFGDRDAVVDVMRRHAGDLHAEIERINGLREWGAKVLVDLDACDRWITARTPGLGGASREHGAGHGDGRAYLARRQAQRGTRDERHRLLLEISSEIHALLSELAVESTTDPPQQRQLSGHEGEMILNGAYLLDDDGGERFLAAARDLTERHADKGMAVQVTGPWPPHHFISLPPLGELGEPA